MMYIESSLFFFYNESTQEMVHYMTLVQTLQLNNAHLNARKFKSLRSFFKIPPPPFPTSLRNRSVASHWPHNFEDPIVEY